MKDQRNRANPYARVHSPTATVSSPAMDPKIWSRFPAELLEHVLSFLPLKTFFNLRSTCKRFNSLVFSPSFVSKHSSSLPSFLLLSHPQFHLSFALYDSYLATWRDLSLSSLSAPTRPSSSLLSASNGLLCFSLPSSFSFLVCNVLANSWRVIKFPFYPFAFDILSLISTPFGYSIFTVSSRSNSNITFVFYSRTNSWREFDGFEPILSDNYHEKGVYFNGCLSFTTPEPFSVVSFDLETGKWERSDAELPNDLTFVRLVSGGGGEEGRGKGKLYLIGGIGRNGISRSMKVWELSEEMGKWVEIERVPEMMCQKFMSVCYHNYHHVYCFGHQGLICICCYTWPEILYYKASRRTWHWLSKCPSLPDKWSCGFRWFSFVPKLYASV
ncbi:F-box/kelch-repeat protein [Morus notabilis]|uniref:F-box/kelch-repeat protein n=1 Tax=Morus notabilis TaxID=981085 RepID=W9T1K2_9ROSA|nr:F-box/kelch-repeat protein At5g43190 [Morus notabilis]EXC36352.1 F-box/kelch-repeat protein [Morus notabilis]